MNRPRGKPFEVGNKMGRGRPKGSPNKKSKELLKMLEDCSVPLMAKCLKMAFDDSDFGPLALYVGKIAPLLRDSGKKMKFPKLPEIPELKDIDRAQAAVLNTIRSGELSPQDGQRVHDVLQDSRTNIQVRELDTRMTAMEELQRNASDEVGTA